MARSRRCACGCGRSLAGRRSDARYHSDACKARAWKVRAGYRLAANSGVRHGNSGPPGLQVSYARLVRALEADYRLLNLPDARGRAEALAAAQLSERQRARLEARDG